MSAEPAGRGCLLDGRPGHDVSSWLQTIGVEAAHVVGHSLGGLVAQELAIRHRSCVKSLVLASTHAGADLWRRAVIESWVLLRRSVTIGLFTRATLPWLVAPDSIARPARSRAWFSSRSETRTCKSRKHLAGMSRPRPSMSGGTGSVGFACLRWCWWASSTSSTLRVAVELAELLPDCRFVILPGVGHMPHIEDKVRFRQEVERFLKKSRASV